MLMEHAIARVMPDSATNPELKQLPVRSTKARPASQGDMDIGQSHAFASRESTLPNFDEQRDLWSSQAADTHGSRNYVGIKDAAVDALIERVIFAKSRGEQVAATRALDRVLLWNHYVVPQFAHDKVWAARWDRFGRPDPLPRFGGAAFPTVWWRDAERGAK